MLDLFRRFVGVGSATSLASRNSDRSAVDRRYRADGARVSISLDSARSYKLVTPSRRDVVGDAKRQESHDRKNPLTVFPAGTVVWCRSGPPLCLAVSALR